MAVEAPLSRYRRTNLLIYLGACIALALWFAYDGYLNQRFIAEHTTEQGQPDGTLVFNQKAPLLLIPAALLLGAYCYAIRNRKLVAAGDGLVFPGGRKIAYEAIEQIDKTHFETKGIFTITYKNDSGRLARCKLTDRHFDNLKPILDHLIAQIT
jgi:hypothetical protein